MNNKVFINNLNNIINTKFDGNVSAFAKICDICAATIHNYLRGKYAPKSKNLKIIANAAGISITALCGDEGNDDQWIIKESSVHYTHKEQELIDMLIAVLHGENEDNKKLIIECIKTFYKARNIADCPAEETKKANSAG